MNSERPASDDRILVLNAGSSSLRFALFASGPATSRVLFGKYDRVGSLSCSVSMSDAAGVESRRIGLSGASHMAALDHLLRRLGEIGVLRTLCAIGHRVVHGGPAYRRAQRVDQEMLAELRRLHAFDPEHLPAQTALLEKLGHACPSIPQVACFDTAFHADLPRVATVLPIPRHYEAQGVRRYGFHGLSYEGLLAQAGPHGRTILAHLGSGASMAAVRDGRPLDTSMGFTPASGLVMSTRSGDIDPGLVEFLLRREKMSAVELTQLLNHQSGLLGVSESSADMRELLAHASSDPRAEEAVALFCYQARKCIGAYAAALGGLDTLVFSGGIGENLPAIRSRICEGLAFLGIELDEQQNSANASNISRSAGRVAVRVIRADEEIVIARSVIKLLNNL